MPRLPVLLEALTGDLAYAARGLRRNPTFTLTAVATLALGIGGTTAAFSLLDGVVLRPLPFHEPERLVEVRELGEGRRFYPSFPNFEDWRDRSSSFEALSAVQPMGRLPVLDLSEPVRVPVVAATRDLVATTGVPLDRGRSWRAEEAVVGGAPVALVSHRFWRDRLGSPEDPTTVPFGLFGRSYRAIGVLPAGFAFLGDADVYLPAEQSPGTVRSAHAYRVVGRLAEGVALATAREEMNALTAAMAQEYAGTTQALEAQLTPLHEMLLGDQRRPLLLLLVAAGLVLLVAAVNLGSTLLARGTVRRRELAVRTSLGASRWRLVRQLLTEALLLAGLGGLTGAALAWGLVEGLTGLGPDVLPRADTLGLDVRALGVGAALSLLAVLLFALLPSLGATRSAVASVVRGRRAGPRSRVSWDVLLGTEAALAVVLLVAAGLMLRSVDRILHGDPGWDPDPVVQLQVATPGGVFQDWEEAVVWLDGVVATLAAAPGVEAVGVTNRTPLDAGDYTAPARDPDRLDNPENYTGWRVVDSGYFQALGTPLLRGRLMEPGELDVAVVNESLARILWPGEEPIGRRVTNNFDTEGRPLEVIGLVQDARDWRWSEEQPEMFVPWQGRPEHLLSFSILVRTAEPGTSLPGLRSRFAEASPRVPADVTLLRDELSSSAAERRFVGAVLTGFAVSGLALALVGIAGVVAYTVSQRRREFGIRKALGARSSGIRRAVRRRVLRAVVPGIGAGILMAWLASGTLEGLLVDVEPVDPQVFGLVPILFLGVAVLAADLPARRGSRVDPATVLREE
jgi:predicted permease